MQFLQYLESVRTPFFDRFFSLVTHLGEETFFIFIGLLFYWCISKKQGYYLLSIGLIGTVLNQFLKLWFRVPRPWVKDPNFTVVAAAKPEATGYSFPSGHTQSAVGIFGGLARWNKAKILRVVSIVLAVLVCFSRLYLGVHTPLDVGVSVLLSLALVFGLYPLIHQAWESPLRIRWLFFGMILFSGLYLIFAHFFSFPAEVDMVNLAHGRETGWKMFGCMVGLYLSFEIDHRLIRFETKAAWWAQGLKLLLGLIPILLIKTFLKQPLYIWIGNEWAADGIRYFLIALVAGCIWPLTFSFFSHLGRK